MEAGTSRENSMPVYPCVNGKWRIGDGPCIYKTKAAAERAYAGYRASKHGRKKRRRARRH